MMQHAEAAYDEFSKKYLSSEESYSNVTARLAAETEAYRAYISMQVSERASAEQVFVGVASHMSHETSACRKAISEAQELRQVLNAERKAHNEY